MEANYKTFPELIEYAKGRMLRSIGRNDPIATQYWFTVKRWASYMPETINDNDLYKKYDSFLDELNRRIEKERFDDAASIYWQIKHLRKMLVNRWRFPPRLSLDWLRAWGKKIEMQLEEIKS